MRAMPSPTSMTVPTSLTCSCLLEAGDFAFQDAGDFRNIDCHLEILSF